MEMWHDKEHFESPEHRRKSLARFVNDYQPGQASQNSGHFDVWGKVLFILFDRESVCQADDAHDHRCLLDLPDSALVSELLRLLPKKEDLAANRNTVQIITNTSAPKRQSLGLITRPRGRVRRGADPS